MAIGILRGAAIVAEARAEALRRTGWWAFSVGLAVFVSVVAATGLPGISSAALWFAAGVIASDTLSLAPGVAAAWCEWRRHVRGGS